MKTFTALALLGIAGSVNAGSVDLPVQVGGAFSIPVTSMKESRFSATVRQQYDFSCGSAALSTLLTYQYLHSVTEQAIFEEMYLHGDQKKIRREGFSLLDMKRYLAAHGFQADGFEAPLERLESANIPAIVLLNENGYNHFVVVKGLRDGRVLIGDPANGTRAIARASFDAMWRNHILFVIVNHEKLARFNVAADWHAAPAAPVSTGIVREGLSGITMPKLGPSDF